MMEPACYPSDLTMPINTDTIIQIEEDPASNDLTTSPDQNVGKRYFASIPFLLISLLLILLVISGISVGVYFGTTGTSTKTTTVSPPKNGTFSTMEPSSSTVEPTISVHSTTTIERPKPPSSDEQLTTDTTTKSATTTCLPFQKYEWLKDVALSSSNKNPRRTSLFSGQVTHARMLTICDRIDKPNKPRLEKWYGAVYLNNVKDESNFDNSIRDNKESIFGSLTKELMWTGCFYKRQKNTNIWKLKCQNDPLFYHNFCNKIGWIDDLRKLAANPNEEDDQIHIVKDYGKPTACWQLYRSSELVSITGQPVGTIPRLPFACMFQDDPSTSGQDAMPGFFKPKWQSGNYLFYDVSATVEDALKECEAHDYQLLTLDTVSKVAGIKSALLKDFKSITLSDKIWTGGYLDISNGNTREWQWLGSPNVITVTSPPKPYIESAVKYLLASIDRAKGRIRDCASRNFVFLGMAQYKDNQEIKYEATLMNSAGQIDQDLFTAKVVCEKKQNL